MITFSLLTLFIFFYLFVYIFFSIYLFFFFFFSSRRRHTRFDCDWSSDVCSSDLEAHSADEMHRRGSGRCLGKNRSRPQCKTAVRFKPVPAPSRKRRGERRVDRKSVV